MSQQNTKTADRTLGPRANLVTFLLALLGTLNFPMPAFSQTQTSVAQETPDFFRQMKDFAAIQNNLVEMAKTAAHKDSFALTQAFYFTSHLNSTATEVWKLAMIYQRLRDQRDVKEVALVFTSDCTRLKTNAKVAIEQLNQRLATMTSGAVIAEATKARDAALRLSDHPICK